MRESTCVLSAVKTSWRHVNRNEGAYFGSKKLARIQNKECENIIFPNRLTSNPSLPKLGLSSDIGLSMLNTEKNLANQDASVTLFQNKDKFVNGRREKD